MSAPALASEQTAVMDHFLVLIQIHLLREEALHCHVLQILPLQTHLHQVQVPEEAQAAEAMSDLQLPAPHQLAEAEASEILGTGDT